MDDGSDRLDACVGGFWAVSNSSGLPGKGAFSRLACSMEPVGRGRRQRRVAYDALSDSLVKFRTYPPGILSGSVQMENCWPHGG